MLPRNNVDRAVGWVDRALGRVEDGLYAATAVLLSLVAAVLLFMAVHEFFQTVSASTIVQPAIHVLDRLLLALMLIELLYTVRVSVRSEGLRPEPFLIVGLIAAMRRILVITAEAAQLQQVEQTEFNRAMIELGLLAVLTLILVGAIILLRRGDGSRKRVESVKNQADEDSVE